MRFSTVSWIIFLCLLDSIIITAGDNVPGDGQPNFHAPAYFPNLSRLKIEQSARPGRWPVNPEETARQLANRRIIPGVLGRISPLLVFRGKTHNLTTSKTDTPSRDSHSPTPTIEGSRVRETTYKTKQDNTPISQIDLIDEHIKDINPSTVLGLDDVLENAQRPELLPFDSHMGPELPINDLKWKEENVVQNAKNLLESLGLPKPDSPIRIRRQSFSSSCYVSTDAYLYCKYFNTINYYKQNCAYVLGACSRLQDLATAATSSYESRFLARQIHDNCCGAEVVTTARPATESPGSPQCQVSDRKVSIDPKIVNGSPADKCEYPWMVVLRLGGTDLCGGALIDESHVITAAHCVRGRSPNDVDVGVGKWDVLDDLTGTYITASTLLVHSSYNSLSYNNDIAIVTLSRPVTFTSCVRPICLPNANQAFPEGMKCIISGWGSMAGGGPSQRILREATIPIYNWANCRNKYNVLLQSGIQYITANNLCAGYTQGGTDTCQGDSGGPLSCLIGSTWTLAGVVSFGYGCAQASYPGVYTRVTSYLSWIAANT